MYCYMGIEVDYYCRNLDARRSKASQIGLKRSETARKTTIFFC